MYKTYTVDEARKKLEHYCAYQERCHAEVAQKLKSMNMIPQAADVIIGHLIEHNYLNEERFACSFARGKFRIKGWGRKRIITELKLRNITQYNINKALREISNNEYIEAIEAIALKFWEASSEVNNQKKKQKLYEFLYRKGYENEIIYNLNFFDR